MIQFKLETKLCIHS